MRMHCLCSEVVVSLCACKAVLGLQPLVRGLWFWASAVLLAGHMLGLHRDRANWANALLIPATQWLSCRRSVRRLMFRLETLLASMFTSSCASAVCSAVHYVSGQMLLSVHTTAHASRTLTLLPAELRASGGWAMAGQLQD